MKFKGPFFIGSDNSGHEYCVPVSKGNEFWKWVGLPDDDEASWDVPDYAEKIEGDFEFYLPDPPAVEGQE